MREKVWETWEEEDADGVSHKANVREQHRRANTRGETPDGNTREETPERKHGKGKYD